MKLKNTPSERRALLARWPIRKFFWLVILILSLSTQGLGLLAIGIISVNTGSFETGLAYIIGVILVFALPLTFITRGIWQLQPWVMWFFWILALLWLAWAYYVWGNALDRYMLNLVIPEGIIIPLAAIYTWIIRKLSKLTPGTSAQVRSQESKF